MRSAAPVVKEGPRINEEIRNREVMLIDQDGQNRGVTETRAAIAMAFEAGLDLVEVAAAADPPVCKIMDYGKFKFNEQKKAAEARKNQKTVEIKEIKLRPAIDDHDYDVKMRAMRRFFEEGDKVKVTLRFRGREMAHQEIGYRLLNRVKDDTGPDCQGRVRRRARGPPNGHGPGPALRVLPTTRAAELEGRRSRP